MRERLVVTALFPYKEVTPGQYDSIAIHGITAYLTDEATDGTDSAESYTTMIYLVKKAMAIVRKSYEALDDSLIGLAEEVRAGIIDALARAIENAVVNGDNSTTHMDDATNAGIVTGDYRKAFRGLRYLGLNKNTVDFGGAALDEADWLAKISEMQETGGVYLDDQAVSRGEVVLIVDQNCYNQLRMLPSFLTKDKAAANATLFGAPVDTVFGIPVVMTPFLPIVDATGVVNATAGSNTLSSVIMVNRTTCRYYTTGAVLAESDRNITNQHVAFTGSVRAGFSSIFDQVDSDPTAVDSDRNNIVVGINVDRA
jgi:HK97 family phage major capsid protein